jgi:hypothetical protein
MRIYLAARFGRRLEMVAMAESIRALGHQVTSRWINGRGKPNADNALYDLTDLTVADAVVSFTEDPKDPKACEAFVARGGRHVEFGYALKAGKQLFIVGPRENIFHRLPEVTVFRNGPALLAHLALVAKQELRS